MINKSNILEIISLLWLIAGLLTHSWWHWLFIGLAVENTLESMYYAYKSIVPPTNKLKEGKDE